MEDHITRFLLFLNEDRKLAANTVAAYQNDLRQLQEYLRSRDASNGHAARVPMARRLDSGVTSEMLDAVTRADISDFVLGLRERGYAPATVARKIAAIKSLFHYLAKNGLIREDPTRCTSTRPRWASRCREPSPSTTCSDC